MLQDRLLPELGGGGNKGNPPEDPALVLAVDAPVSDPSKSVVFRSEFGLFRPGMAIVKVCPSFKL